MPHGRLLGHPGQLAGVASELQDCVNDPLAEQLRSIDLSDDVKVCCPGVEGIVHSLCSILSR